MNTTAKKTTKTTTKKKPTGYILWQGASLLDGQPIVAIAIVKSTNEKTGNMVQTYIMRDDLHPMAALKTGQDESVCGNCKHRPVLGGAYYVNVGQGVRAVWEAHKRGNYPTKDAAEVGSMVAGRMVRLGTYGDPAAVPAAVWQSLTAQALGVTGYTHQWTNKALEADQLEALRGLCMASADDPEEKTQANAMGWRTFRVRMADEPLTSKEFACPASNEAGNLIQCAQCKACDGNRTGRVASVAIITHGAKASRFIKMRLERTV